MTPTSGYAHIIAKLVTALDTQLDAQGTQMCRDFDPSTDNPVRLLRDLRDLCVRYSWSSGFILQVINTILSDEPDETKIEADERRQALLAKWE